MKEQGRYSCAPCTSVPPQQPYRLDGHAQQDELDQSGIDSQSGMDQALANPSSCATSLKNTRMWAKGRRRTSFLVV